MAITGTVNRQTDLGNGLKLITGVLAFDASYVGAAGEPLDLSSYFPGGSVHHMDISDVSDKTFQHDGGTPTSGVIFAYSLGVYIASTTDLSAFSQVTFAALGE